MRLIDKIKEAKHVFIIGNGGSYANAQHIQNDLLSCGVKAFTLDPATLTAFGNDFGYENVFSLWLEKVGSKGDLLIALSGSGKSPNILKACEAAERLGMEVWKEFGAAQNMNMQEAEEFQVWVGHNLMRELKRWKSR